jgi:hypothetical protein
MTKEAWSQAARRKASSSTSQQSMGFQVLEVWSTIHNSFITIDSHRISIPRIEPPSLCWALA